MTNNNFIQTNNKLNVSVISLNRLEPIEKWLQAYGIPYEIHYSWQWQALFSHSNHTPDIIVISTDELEKSDFSLNNEVLSKLHFLFPETYVFLFGSLYQKEKFLGNVFLSGEQLELSKYLFLKFVKYIWGKKCLDSFFFYYSSPVQAIVGVSDTMKKLRTFLLQMSKITVPVLFCGETGVGKDLAAKVLHLLSPAQELIRIPLVTWISPQGRKNILKKIQNIAQKNILNTVYLDRIDMISIPHFFEILKSLQRCNGAIRIIASAAHCQDKLLAKWAQFHELSPVVFHITPLRERKEDIPVLIEYLLKEICIEYRMNYEIPQSPQFQDFLDYEWYGNGWELKQKLKEWIVYKKVPTLQPTSGLRPAPSSPSYLFEQKLTLEQIKLFVFLEAYRHFRGDRELICQHLGISKSTFFRLKKGIRHYLEPEV